MAAVHLFYDALFIIKNNCARQQDRADCNVTHPVTPCPDAPVSRMEVLHVMWSDSLSGLLCVTQQNSISQWSISTPICAQMKKFC